MKGLVAAGVALVAIVVLHPWTVRPLHDAGSTAAPASVDPSAVAADLWRASLRPALEASAQDARVVLDAIAASASDAQKRFGRDDGSGSWYVAIRGSGRVLSVNRESSHGTADVDLEPYDRRPDLTIQIGPVVRGSGLRDATPLAPFSRFTNQLQYADVANALNASAESDVLAPIRPTLAAGQIVRFVGVAGREGNAGGPLSPMVPIQLTIVEARK